VLGLELAGRLLALEGNHPEELSPGEPVMALVPGGAYATHARVDPALLHRIPEDWSFAQAAAVPEALYTAHLNLVDEAGLSPGETVLIHAAAGGIGTTAVQLASELGAVVLATAGTDEKAESVKALGADHVFNYKQTALKEALREQAPAGIDVVFDSVGGAHYAQLHPSVLKPYGRWVLIGLLGGRQVELDLGRMLVKNLRLIGSTLRSRPEEVKRRLAEDIRRRWLPRYRKGHLRPVVDRVFPMEEVNQAHRYIEENRPFGKVVVQLVQS
jgi:NADPH:quinone reductase-like Zn-dependent oxidoreductase